MLVQVVESAEEPTTQYLQIAETEDVQGTEAAVSVLQNLRFNTQNGLCEDLRDVATEYLVKCATNF